MSIILVLENGVLDRAGFWIAVAVIYGSMYYFIFTNVVKQLRKLRTQVALLESSMPVSIVGPLRTKHVMYMVLLGTIFIAFIIEIICHAIIAESGTLWVTLCAYEVSNVCIFVIIGYIFRPTEYSPFFFMVPARMNDARTRAIATIEAADDDYHENEVDLAPLLPPESMSSREGSRRRVASIPSSMILIRTPDKVVSVGVSSIQRPIDTAPSRAGVAPNDEENNAQGL